MKASQILANRRKVEQSIRGYGSIFRKLFRQVILDQEARILQRVPAIAKPTLKNVMDREYENKVLALAMRPVYITIMTDSANEILKDFPKPKEAEFKKAVDPRTLLDEKIFKYADKYSIAMAKYVNQTTAKEIKKTILDGMKEGLHYNEISKNIGGKIFNNLKEGERAKRLAYTEAHGLVENGSYEGAAASGVVQEKTWSSAADARPTHLAANGQTVLIDDVFIVGAGYRLRFPGDTSLGAGLEEIMRCRCSVLYSSIIHEDRITTSQELLAEQPIESEYQIIPEERKLMETPITSDTPMDRDISGANASRIIKFKDGTQGIFKPVEGEQTWLRKGSYGTLADREMLASRIGESMGLDNVPITVLREINGEMGSLQKWISTNGAQRWNELSLETQNALFNSIEGGKMNIFDALIQNSDRHGGNYLVDNASKFFYIDNGASLGTESLYNQTTLRNGMDKILGTVGGDKELAKISSNIKAMMTDEKLKILMTEGMTKTGEMTGMTYDYKEQYKALVNRAKDITKTIDYKLQALEDMREAIERMKI